jgi:hypothetical protein
VRRHSLAKNEELLEAQVGAQLRAGDAADDDRFDLRQVPFQILGILMEQDFADDRPQDCVAQKLQPLVRAEPMDRARGVRQGGLQQALVVENVTDALFASVGRVELLGVRERGRNVRHGRDLGGTTGRKRSEKPTRSL